MSLQTTQSISAQISDRGWNLVCHITYTRDTWVKVMSLPSAYAWDEAKLLCQESLNTWVAWIPDHGEVVLDRSNFYC